MSSAFNIPAGFALVPLEPTLDMGWAYLKAARASSPTIEHSFNHAGYRAALAAAPTAPVDAVPGEPVAWEVLTLGEWRPTRFPDELRAKGFEVRIALPDRERAASLVTGERTPTDFALEHAEYLAGKAERLVEAVGAFHIAQVMLEEDYDADRDSDITELNVNLEAAGEKLSEACRATLSGVHEFRKRRDRASAGEAQS